MNITIYKGNTHIVRVPIEINSEPLDLTDYTVTFTVKKNSDATAVLFSKTGSKEENVAIFELTTTHTNKAAGNYVYDVFVTNDTNKYTVAIGKFALIQTVRTPA